MTPITRRNEGTARIHFIFFGTGLDLVYDSSAPREADCSKQLHADATHTRQSGDIYVYLRVHAPTINGHEEE